MPLNDPTLETDNRSTVGKWMLLFKMIKKTYILYFGIIYDY